MRFLKDKLLIFILLTALLQLYIVATRGDWETKVEQKGANPDDKNHLKLTDDLFIESEHSINVETRTIGSHTYFVTDKCFKIENLEITISELLDNKEVPCKNTKTRVADFSTLEFDSLGRMKEETLIQTTKIKICPGQRIEISNWFEFPDSEASIFKIRYSVLTTEDKKISGEATLIKRTSFEINGRHHYDFIILLYPVLWWVLGLLTLVKIYRVVSKK